MYAEVLGFATRWLRTMVLGTISSHGPVEARQMNYLSLALCSVLVQVPSESLPVYYDYVEEGQLRGGKIMIDRNDPAVRAVFGFDGPESSTPWLVTTIIDNGPSDNRIDLVMLGDGYTEAELGDYAQHVGGVLNDFFAEEPLAAYATCFNVHRVEVISAESGVDEPDYGIYRDTALDMTYNCMGIPRLLCISLYKARTAAAFAPDDDYILALANSTRYGGAGYPWANLGTLAGNNDLAAEIALHEFGHAFADLADEYDYGGGVTYNGPEPDEANVSVYTSAQQITWQRKWYRWMTLPHIDTFEGAYYYLYGIYRPTGESKMRSLGQPFHEVNGEQFIVHLYREVSPIDDATPSSGEPLNSCAVFFVVPLEPTDHSLEVHWSLDGSSVPGITENIFIPDLTTLTPGLHQVGATVVDNTSRVRDETARDRWMTEHREWEFIAESCCLPGGTCAVLCEAECTVAGGVSMGTSVVCEGDVDGDAVDAQCGDECPTDPNKVLPGMCGCLIADTDADDDGTPDCTDRCDGVEDAVFAPGCVEAIPTVSGWGLVVMLLLLLAGIKIKFGGRQLKRV